MLPEEIIDYSSAIYYITKQVDEIKKNEVTSLPEAEAVLIQLDLRWRYELRNVPMERKEKFRYGNALSAIRIACGEITRLYKCYPILFENVYEMTEGSDIHSLKIETLLKSCNIEKSL